MGTNVDTRFSRLRIMFFEGGEFGGSVRSLANLLRGLVDLGCEAGFVSHFRRTGPVDLGSLECVQKNYCLDLPSRVRPRPDIISRVLGIPYLTRFGLRYLFLAFYALIKFRPQIAYLNNNPGGHLPVVIAAKVLGIPLVCHLRGIRNFSLADKLCATRIEQFIALTKSVRRFYHDQGIQRDKISQIYNPFNIIDFDKASNNKLDGLIIEDGSIYVIQVGALTEHKRPDLAIESLILAKKEIPNLKLVLAGDGPIRGKLEQMVGKHGLDDSVIFLGQCDHIPALLKRCHIGLLVSCSEGQGYCFMEYMAGRLPVVTWAMPGIGDELVVDSQNGLVVSEPSPQAIARALVQLCHSPELRAKMGQAGREFIATKRFSSASHVRRIHSILMRLASC